MTELSRLHGLTVAAPFLLGPESSHPATVDWYVSEGSALPADAQSREPDDPVVARIAETPSFYLLIEHSSDRFTFRFHEFADAAIDTTLRQVTWHALPGAERARIPTLMGGTVMAALCQIAGHLVLHASAIEIDGAGVAFVGDSGAGKSTLAALACLGGARLLTDDVLRVDSSDGVTYGFRGAAQLRLRPGSSALAAGARPPTMSADGRHLMSPTLSESDSVPLTLILLPRVSDAVKALALEPVEKQAAAISLLAAPRVRGWRHATAGSLFDQLMDAAVSVPVMELVIPKGYHAARGAPRELTDLIKSSL